MTLSKTGSQDLKMGEVQITKEHIVRDLRALGIKEGGHVGASLSFKSIGHVSGGPEAFVDALIEAVGYDGTLMMNSYTRFSRLSKVRSDETGHIFDHRTTEGTTGLIPETLRKREGSLRSRHPTNSMTAIGNAAIFLTEGHDESATAYMPYSRLAEINGKILCMGLGDRLIGIRHEAQYLAGLLSVVPFKIGVKYRDDDGNVKLFVRRDKGGCIKRLPELVPALREAGMIKEGKVGMARSLLMPARDVLEAMTNMLKKNPALNLCDDISCLWCREVERRLDLYAEIERPAFFQRSRLIRSALALINRFRL
jgi:aminoglycoside N3'-acetyltransferase